MAEASEERTVYGAINKLRQLPEGSVRRPYYTGLDLKAMVPTGIPSMAAMQALWPNIGTFRTFEYLHWRELQVCESQLSYLQDQLHKLDVEELEKLNGEQRARVPFDKSIFNDCLPDMPTTDASDNTIPETLNTLATDITSVSDTDNFKAESIRRRQNLSNHIYRLLKKERKLVKSLKDINTCPRVHYEAQDQLFTAARELHKLDKEALEPLRAIDERAYVSIDPVHQRLQNLWLSAPSWRKILRFFLSTTPLPDSSSSSSSSSSSQQHSQIYSVFEVRTFGLLQKVLATIFFSSLVVVPVGVIFLGGLDKRNCFAVLVVFGLFFAIVMCAIEQRFGPYLVGVVAYYAALSTFLGNNFP